MQTANPFSLDPASHVPLYVQLRDRLRERIAEGVLRAGERLAPTRDLARDLKVNRTTVSAAYAELEAEGLLKGHVGRGTFVAGKPASAPTAASRIAFVTHRPFDFPFAFPDQQPEDGLDALMQQVAEPGVVSFASAHPPAYVLPMAEFRRCCDRVLRRQGSRILQPGPSDGYAPLKEWLSNWLGRQGLAASPQDITITNGCQQSLDLLARTLAAHGHAVALENPTYPGAVLSLRQVGARLFALPVGENGIDPASLEALLEHQTPRLILLTTSFQNPTGTCLSPAARRGVLELAQKHRVPVAENHSYGLLGYSGSAFPSFSGSDGIHLGSFSKLGFPGLRLGWCVAPPRISERLRKVKQATDLHTDNFVQAVMLEFAERGYLDRTVAAVRRAARRNAEVLARGVERHFPEEVSWRRPAGGFSSWFRLPEGIDAEAVLQRARDRKVLFTPGRFFYFHDPQPNTFRLSFANLRPAAISKGLAILGDAIRAELRHSKRSRPARSAAGGWALV